jgi:hypothetical protein
MNMKKVYISPETFVQKVELQYLMTASDAPKVHNDEDEADPEGEVLSRRGRDVWEDEEEEDDNK